MNNNSINESVLNLVENYEKSKILEDFNIPLEQAEEKFSDDSILVTLKNAILIAQHAFSAEALTINFKERIQDTFIVVHMSGNYKYLAFGLNEDGSIYLDLKEARRGKTCHDNLNVEKFYQKIIEIQRRNSFQVI